MPVPRKPTVLLDPYLLMSLSDTAPGGALSSCESVRFAVCDHLPPEDFHPSELGRILQTAAREDVDLLPVYALEMADLLHMRDVLVLHQIAAIAVARSRRCLFASDCDIFRRMAGTALKSDRVLCGPDVQRRLHLN